MSKHTPGPWQTTRNNQMVILGASFRIVWSEDTGMDVAYCYPHADADNGNANAALIAAAPDMLLALERIVEFGCLKRCRPDCDEHPCSICAEARAAIAKARGGA